MLVAKFEDTGNPAFTVITDPDVDVRKAALDVTATLAPTLALYIKPNDIAPMILPIPLCLAHENQGGGGGNGGGIGIGTGCPSGLVPVLAIIQQALQETGH